MLLVEGIRLGYGWIIISNKDGWDVDYKFTRATQSSDIRACDVFREIYEMKSVLTENITNHRTIFREYKNMSYYILIIRIDWRMSSNLRKDLLKKFSVCKIKIISSSVLNKIKINYYFQLDIKIVTFSVQSLYLLHYFYLCKVRYCKNSTYWIKSIL